jgi:two-component system response regulator HydG
VADLSPVTQPKILRVLQEGEFERVGGTRTIRVDVRIVAATNQDLTALVRDKRFREDLFYRLNVITIVVPPLRERREDIPVLAQHFLRVYAAKNNRRLEGLSDEALGCLETYSWPGNVRELENVIERAVVLARGGNVEASDLPPSVADRSVMLVRGADAEGAGVGDSGAGPSSEPGVFKIRVGTPLAEVAQRLLEETLRLTKGNKTLTARMLGIDPKTVFRKLKAGEAEDATGGDAATDERS